MSLFTTEVSVTSLNVRGLKDNTERKALFLFCKGQKNTFTFMQETHSMREDETFWTQQWGEKIFFSHGTERSGGVAILLNNCSGKHLYVKADEHGHWLIAVMDLVSK